MAQEDYKEIMDRQFVPDTIEVPVQWLKELVELNTEISNPDGFIYCKLLSEHIDLIREKLKV